MTIPYTDAELLAEMLRRDPWLDRNKAAPILNITTSTLRKRDSQKLHKLPRYRKDEKGHVFYKYSDVLNVLKQQQVPV